MTFEGGGGGVLDSGFTHLVPSTAGGYVPGNLNLDTIRGVLTVTTNMGDFARRDDGSQNNQDNHLAMRVDAAAAPQGRAEDVLVALEREIRPGLTLRLGYRLLEGGADNDEVYTFTALHYGVIGLGLQF